MNKYFTLAALATALLLPACADDSVIHDTQESENSDNHQGHESENVENSGNDSQNGDQTDTADGNTENEDGSDKRPDVIDDNAETDPGDNTIGHETDDDTDSKLDDEAAENTGETPDNNSDSEGGGQSDADESQEPETNGDTDTDSNGSTDSTDTDTDDAEQTCTNACHAGTKKCEANAVWSCTADTNSCLTWQKTKSCEGGTACNTATYECESGCTNACKAGETKCDANQTAVLTCVTDSNGCSSWKSTACAANKYCQNDTKKCEYMCGSEEDCKPFSIVLMPDTQYYMHSDATIKKLNKMFEWIHANAKSQNIKFMISLGDITDQQKTSSKGPTPGIKEWERALSAHKNLHTNGIRYSIATGNHDYYPTDGSRGRPSRGGTKFLNYFNDSFMQTKGLHTIDKNFSGFKYGTNSWYTFNVGKLKFAVFALEFAVRKDVMCWADKLIQTKFKDHFVIIETHNYLTVRAGYSDPSSYFTGADGEDLAKELVRRHSNVIMAVGGHVADAERKFVKGYPGNQIMELLVDYQKERPDGQCSHGADGGGNGWFRLMTIDPKLPKNNVTVKAINGTDVSKFYCSSIYNEAYIPNTSDPYTGSVKDITTGGNAAKEPHGFTASFDLTKPISYVYKPSYLGFTARSINNVSDGEQLNPAVAMARPSGKSPADAKNDNVVVVWEDGSKDSAHHDIAARILCSEGCVKSNQFTVNPTTAGPQTDPDVAMDNKGNFTVVWVDDNDNNGSTQIYMRGFNADGSQKFGVKTVNTESKGNQYKPAIAMNPDGKFVVVWEDKPSSKSATQVLMRGFNADGSQAFADVAISPSTTGTQLYPDIAMAADGSFVVTWQDDSDGNGLYQIKARRYHANGSAAAGVFTVNSEAKGQQKNPSIGMNARGDFYIAYMDDADNNGVYRLKARGYNKAGTQIFADTHVSGSGEDTGKSAVCVADNGNAVFTWYAAKQNNINRRKLIGGKFNAQKCAHRITTGTQSQPDVACAADGHNIAVWRDDLDGNKIGEIYGRGFDHL